MGTVSKHFRLAVPLAEDDEELVLDISTSPNGELLPAVVLTVRTRDGKTHATQAEAHPVG